MAADSSKSAARTKPMSASVLTAMLATVAATAAAAAPAFPGATGYAANITAGRGGSVCQVTNLNDSGPGSLRACIATSGPRTVVFRVGGTITLNSPLAILNGRLTIAGQTAPPPGIQLRMAPTSIGQPMYVKGANSANVLIRHLKLRPGTPGQIPSQVDCLSVENTHSVYLDHLSCSFAYDEGFNGHKDIKIVTISDSIIGPNVDPHSKGSLWCSNPQNWCGQITEVSNLYFSNRDRNPNLDGKGGKAYKFDIINNFYYNPKSEFAEIWCSYSNNIATNGTYANFVGNIFRAGPQTASGRTVFNFYPNNVSNPCTPQAWQSGNEIGPDLLLTSTPAFLVREQIGKLSAPVLPLGSARTRIQSTVGAFWWSRDPLDARIVSDAFSGGGPTRVITDPAEYGGLPALAELSGPADFDRDGMSDVWERENGFNPAAADNNGDSDGDGFTNLEEYLADRAAGDQR